MQIIDTHQHILEQDSLSYSWCRSDVVLNRPYTHDDYRIEAAGLNIVGSIFVEADVDEPQMEDETRLALSLTNNSELNPPVLGVVASVRPEAARFLEQVIRIADHPRLKGVRRILHTEPDELSRSVTFRRNVARLPEFGLSFDICVLACQLPLASELVDACPHVLFILDHAGNPPLRKGDLRQWKRDLRELSRRENVSCKLSGLVTQADHLEWQPDDLSEAVEFAIECFGWDRVMFGSDWPVCKRAAALRSWVTTLVSLTDSFGTDNQQKLFHDNALRIYRCAKGE